ncbi:oxidoreductase [Helicobacter sp. 16-1353]|uniref:Gfo/Idh/MocA family protein n=1 Tax=Helicobacter sp. 16-1353 TaxID=2004996 RepID=UPI000DCF1E1C|nr:Gfo/Idh/MocA family oxidoreductase [Helicobacter sp. 16-1353]RAX51374.1 oxidoreductase [Helicobacter sp. 16-1353]
MKPIKIALLGIGKMGQNHLRILNMLKDVEIAFIYDTNEESCKKIAQTYNVKMSQDLEADLAMLSPSDGAIIVTPTFSHFDYISKVSEYVKNIFVEKPLTNTLESAQVVIDLAQKKSLNIQVGFIERYNPAIITLKNILSHSGKIINVDISRTNKASSRITDVDVVIDLMIHDIDLALNINGDVSEIYAQGVVVEGMIEFARAILTHKNGSFSNILASRITEKRIRQISVTTDKEYIDCNLLSKEVFVNKQSVEQRFGNVQIHSNTETIEVRGQEALLSELIDFADICKNEKSKSPESTKSPENQSLGLENQMPNFPNQFDGMRAIEIAHKIQTIIHKKAN